MKKLLVIGLTTLLLVGCNVGKPTQETVEQDTKQVTTENPKTEATTEVATTEVATTEITTTEMTTTEMTTTEQPTTEAPQSETATTESITTEAKDIGVIAVEAVRKQYQQKVSASNPGAHVDFELSEYSPEQDLAGTYYLVKAIDKNKKTANLLQSFKYYGDGNIVAE